MRYYEIATTESFQELDEDLKSKLAKLAKLGAAAGTAATLGYGAGVATNQPRVIQQTPASIMRDMPAGPDEPAGYTVDKKDTALSTSLRPKPRPADLSVPAGKGAAATPANNKVNVLTPGPDTVRPQPRPWTKDMMTVDPKLQAAADAANAPNMVDNVSDNIEVENMLIAAAKKAGMTDIEIRAFLAQANHESHNFNSTKEYGTKRYFRHNYDIRHNPRVAKLLGNTEPGDGVKYHGRGYLQITGRYNYAAAEKALGIPLLDQPELLEDPKIAAEASVWFWMWRVHQNVRNMYDVKEVTYMINKELTDLEKREELFDLYKNLKV